MRIDIQLKNIELNQKNINLIKKKVATGIKEGLRNAGKYITDEIKREMDLPKSGNIYIFTRPARSRRRETAFNSSPARSNTSFFRKRLTYPAPPGLKISAGSSYTHIASNSSGNESSAVLTGKLKASIYNVSKGSNQQVIGAKAKHAAVQEYGSSNVAPRNNFSRPIAQNKTQMANRIRNSINTKLMEIK